MEVNVVILGGTFDPPHYGHLQIAQQVRDRLEADVAWLLPAAEPQLRTPPRASAADRLAMCRAAIVGCAGLAVCDAEVVGGGPSYTVDTDAILQSREPGTAFWWVVGADVVRDFRSWHRSGDLAAQARFVIVNRSGVPVMGEVEATACGFLAERTRHLTVNSPVVSSSAIRAELAVGRSVEGLVPGAVAELIRNRRLYRLPYPRGLP